MTLENGSIDSWCQRPSASVYMEGGHRTQGSLLSNLSLKSVLPSQNDVEDIEDLLTVLDGIVTDIRANPTSEMDLQCLMYKYAHLEASVLESLEYNTRQTTSPQEQKLLSDFIERYTVLGPDFQTGWNERLWNAYGIATKGHRRSNSQSHEPPSLRDLGNKLLHVQGLARTLTHLTTSPGSKEEPRPPPRTRMLQPVIDAAVKAHERQRLLGSKRGTAEGCCHRCRIS